MKRIRNSFFLLVCGMIIGNLGGDRLPDIPWLHYENVPGPVKLVVDRVGRELIERVDSTISHALPTAIGSDSQTADTGSSFKQNVGLRVKQAGEQIEEPKLNGFYGQLVEEMNPAFSDSTE